MAGKGKKTQTLTQSLSLFLGKTLLPDLKERAKQSSVNAALTRQWQAEKAASRTADEFPAWEQGTLEQVGAAWVLSCVFVRTLEDRDLLPRRRLAGPGAEDSEQLFFEIAPSLTARDYLLTVFKEVASLPGAEDLLGPRHNPVWRLGPSAETARALLDFFREQDDQGQLVWRFAGADTRFLGDLYQDLSEDVRKRYALLQTPDFVERFILQQTLEPAITEFGLETVRVIDPTCGSGHFLLGAFDRLLAHRRLAAPAIDVREHALAALGQVYGVDVNPYAVAIARFRLTLVYLQRTGITKLAQAPRLPLNLVVADSLLHGAKNTNLLFAEYEKTGGDYKVWDAEIFALEEPREAHRILGQRYHAVVGNPPYINVPDAALRKAYRDNFPVSCHRTYQLVSPFVERFFQLAENRGFVGGIVGNGFMKREFGKPLVEKILPQFDLTKIIDTSGAYIPGHGTPTVILFGRNQKSVSTTLRAILGKRGEPSTPENAESGLVWRSIAEHGDEPGFENDFISVVDSSRDTFRKHPWSLGGGGAADLKELLEERADTTLGDLVAGSIGRAARTGDDDVYSWPFHFGQRGSLPADLWRSLLIGENVRDWSSSSIEKVFFPYGEGLSAIAPESAAGATAQRFLWPWRTKLAKRATFQGDMKAAGLHWFEYMQYTPSANSTPLSIAFAEVATHNHFVLDRGGKVFKQTAPIIKLPESATEDDHLSLLAYLNSSTACFWMKQVFQPKHSAEHKTHPEPERNRYQHAGTGLAALPIPTGLMTDPILIEGGRWMDELARERNRALWPDGDNRSTGRAMVPDWQRADFLREQMIAVQEEIDWRVYFLFGLFKWDERSLIRNVSCPRGARPFEQLHARRSMVRRRDHLVPLSEAEVPPQGQLSQNLVSEWAKRRDAISQNTYLSFIECALFKRQWRDTDDNVDEFSYRHAQSDRRLKDALLDAGETFLRKDCRILPARSIVEELRGAFGHHSNLVDDLEKAGLLVLEVLHDETVPATSADSYSDSGLEIFSAWRQTWSLQRREDLGESVGDIPVPPKYDQKDYRDANYWRLRGKLDVPKERFISYPGCEKDGDPSPLIGWAGWNHLQRAQSLVALYQERKNDDGWPRERLMPMLVGLHELMFWLELWHSQPDAGSQNPAREFKQFLDAELHTHQLTVDDLEAWRPLTRADKAAAKRAAAKTTAAASSLDEPAVDTSDPAAAKPKRTRRRKTDVASETP